MDASWPNWLKTRREHLPAEIEASYVSYDSEAEAGEASKQEAKAVLLTPGSLWGLRITVERTNTTGSRKGSIKLAGIPLTAVQSVVTSCDDEWVSGDPGTLNLLDYSATIKLDRDLAPWETSVDLPVNPSQDYRKNPVAASGAAKRFVEALLAASSLRTPGDS